MKIYTRTVTFKGHKSDIKGLVTEKVFYDGRPLSNGLSLKGTAITFGVTEDGMVEWWRNGMVE